LRSRTEPFSFIVSREGVAILTLAPLALLIGMMSAYSTNLPRWDDWTYVYGAIRHLEETWDWGYVWAKQGVHLSAVPKLYYHAIGRFADWNLKAGLIVNGMAIVGVFVGVAMLLRRTMPDDTASRLFYPLAALCSFSLCQWPLFFSVWGILWLALPLYLRLGMLAANTRLSLPALTALLVGLALLGSFTLSAGFPLWLAFPAFLILHGRISLSGGNRVDRLCLGAFAAGAGLILLLMLGKHGELNPYDEEANFLAMTEAQEFSPLGWALTHPVQASGFLFCILGSSAGYGLDTLIGWSKQDAHLLAAGLAGAAAVALFLATLAYLRARRFPSELTRRLSPWLTIGAMELGMAMLVTIGRAGSNTMERALSPHYGMIGLQFQFAVFAGAWLIWRHYRDECPDAELRGVLAAVMSRLGAVFKCVVGFFVTLHLLGHLPAAKAIVHDHEERGSLANAGYFARVMPDIMLPLPYRKAGMERLELMMTHGVVEIASQEDIARMMSDAQDNPVAGIIGGPPEATIKPGASPGMVEANGTFIYPQEGLYAGAHPVVATLVFPNGGSALVSMVARPTGTVSSAGGVFEFRYTLPANPFAAARVGSVHLLLQDERRFIRVYNGSNDADRERAADTSSRR